MAQSVHTGKSTRTFLQVAQSGMMQLHGAGVLYFSRNAETAISQSTLTGLCHSSIMTTKGGTGDPEAYPSCSVTCMSLHLTMPACISSLATSTGWALGGNSGSQ
jgi:hypothetical protein